MIEINFNDLEIPEISKDYKEALFALISAETFHLRHYYSPEINLKINYKQGNDKRIFIDVLVIIKEENIPTFQLRPFIDKSCQITACENNILMMHKAYFVTDLSNNQISDK
jgi:hypothetical protein